VWFEIMNLRRDVERVTVGHIPVFTNDGGYFPRHLLFYSFVFFLELNASYKRLLPCWNKCMSSIPENRPSIGDLKMELCRYR